MFIPITMACLVASIKVEIYISDIFSKKHYYDIDQRFHNSHNWIKARSDRQGKTQQGSPIFW